MADGSKIEWTDATWNPITGCAVVSPGCTNCYAMKLAGGRLKNHASRAGLTSESNSGPVWNGSVRWNQYWLDQPLRWTKPRMIFVCAHGDLFYEQVPTGWIDRVFAVMALAPHHTFQVLTKRPMRARNYLQNDPRDSINATAAELMHWDKMPTVDWPLPNVWLGTSVEDQVRADIRLQFLRSAPAAVRWISAEPLLGRVDLKEHISWIDWVVAGGESGPGARPMHPIWARSLRDQCAMSGTPFHFKQWGDWVPDQPRNPENFREVRSVRPVEHARHGEVGSETWPANEWMARVGKRRAGRILDGETWDEMPEVAA